MFLTNEIFNVKFWRIRLMKIHWRELINNIIMSTVRGEGYATSGDTVMRNLVITMSRNTEFVNKRIIYFHFIRTFTFNSVFTFDKAQ